MTGAQRRGLVGFVTISIVSSILFADSAGAQEGRYLQNPNTLAVASGGSNSHAEIAEGSAVAIAALSHARTVSRADSAYERCEALEQTDFYELPDAPTQIVEAKVPATRSIDQSPYCEVRGYVWPQVGFELRLPISNWNGKFIEMGCGGACGTTRWAFWCPLHRGYACLASDMGHTGKGPDMLWSYNNLQAQIDLNVRGPHVVALAGKAISEAYYGKKPHRAYFMGCSSGGVQALSQAQRFPWDFDGIIGLSGSPYRADMLMHYLWTARVLRGPDQGPRLSRSDLRLTSNAAVAECDMDDGVRDRIISNPYRCRFDPAALLCKTGMQGDCLKEDQVEAVKRVYSGPVRSDGTRITYMRGLLPGSEEGWEGYEANENWSLGMLRYMGFTPAPGLGWKPADFDFNNDYKRLGTAETLWSPANPDLIRFKDSGGKLLYAFGLSDAASNPAAAVEYYEKAEKLMGGRTPTQEFFRLFMVPGMGHCSGGNGAFAIDYLTYMEDWVERGIAPSKLVGAHVDPRNLPATGPLGLRFPLDASIPVAFTRPIYPYPLYAKYLGSGDPNDASSFGPVEPR